METFTSYMPTWNAHGDLKENIIAFDQAVKAVGNASMILGFSNATNSKLQADVINFVYDGSLPIMDYKHPESSIDYASKVVNMGTRVLKAQTLEVRKSSERLPQTLAEMKKNWQGEGPVKK